MKTLFTSEVVSKGGRAGSLQSPDQLLSVVLGNPLVVGVVPTGPNPEHLFAGAYAACFHGALGNAASTLGIPLGRHSVRALVSLTEEDEGGYELAIELRADLPGVDETRARLVMETAHKTCPYSKALRGGARVTLNLEKQAKPIW